MANGWSLLVSILFIAVFCGVSWFASPKGENQTIWRSTLILSAFACWLMWIITFLAQWHPLIVPERDNLRPQYQNGPVKPTRRF
ncbi:ATP synthase subunit H-domain-containing protein [Neohortaea acidophila]|uniref:ATP synthase subunit H-domain-containing protein n=1 Tax=Neohortaea acidophila TaxID=245834 RepID=A0A6A6PZI1_9PEZI|nr:ATP synthase subunit H-domain-containing protein [Neohortaea acidophila]KAF2484843.1 ATP synthase subunit H-domain-containing protein [Neohortaea acidophila]